ncbi:MAG: glycosyltransferase family 2 protein [Erysipelotrichaceae bacterium]|nr:glycosyltransferase family 2 protein [Erysipelotrichaceae bacterium]
MAKTKTKKDLLSVIVPCFNEQEALPIFYKELNQVLKNMDIDHEIILIDDGSRDETLKVMRELAKKDKKIRYLSFSRNFGKEAAMYAGFVNAKGDYALTMDADMQDPPSLLPKMYEIIKTGEYDSVATRRVNRKGESKVRSFFARMFYKIINKISDAQIVDGARDFRLMDRRMLDAIISMCEYNRFSKGIFGWVGFKTYWLDFENVERVAGTTSWSFWGLTKYAIDGIINFSNVPLDIASYFGLLMTVIAFIMLIFIIVRKMIFGDPVAGWASTMCVIIFIGGIQLFCLGIMGQYLGKTYMETKHRQHYIIAESNDDQMK